MLNHNFVILIIIWIFPILTLKKGVYLEQKGSSTHKTTIIFLYLRIKPIKRLTTYFRGLAPYEPRLSVHAEGRIDAGPGVL
jgi:hypothetical protein